MKGRHHLDTVLEGINCQFIIITQTALAYNSFFVYSNNAAETIGLLLEAGADPNVKFQDSGYTALFVAILSGDTLAAEQLASCNKTDFSIQVCVSMAVAIQLACMSDQKFVLMQDDQGFTVLHTAVHRMDHYLTRVLLRAGADPTYVNFDLDTPIHLAAKGGAVLYVQH